MLPAGGAGADLVARTDLGFLRVTVPPEEPLVVMEKAPVVEPMRWLGQFLPPFEQVLPSGGDV
jgi:hypothetical protein